MKTIFSLLLLVAFSFSSYSQIEKEKVDCRVLKDCKLRYIDIDDPNAYILIKGNKITEYLDGGRYYIKSELTWLNDCEYTAKILEINIPEFPFEPGTLMNVKINKIENGMVYYTSYISEEKIGSDGVFELVADI
ncbi:hypothetical protein [Flavobacterium sp.]|uniref:hypothetical protein n=1 Tax=Flavobacterium sp. TaxID=239 RepID=UPI0028BD3E02|nr:hypothetical protein [Flavobacterium sp.]